MSQRAARGVAAAVGVATEHGLVVENPVVLRALSSVLVRLDPHPLVARAAVGGAGAPRPGGLARTVREVRVVEHLAARGAPAVAPSPLLPAGPYVHGGVPVAVLARLAHDPTRRLDGPALGSSLRRVHDDLAGYDGPLPSLPHLAETRGWLARPEVLAGTPPRLRGRLRAAVVRAEAWLAATGLPQQALHGDAHSANALLTAAGPRWVDFEDACLGPVEWDLACLVATARYFGGDASMAGAALAAYGPHETATVDVLAEARAVMVVAWGWLAAGADPKRTRLAERRTQELAAALP